MHPITPTILLAGFNRSYYQAGIYLSQDSGETWANVLPNTEIEDIEFDPTNPRRIYASTISTLGGIPGGIFQSEDTGLTWQRVSDLWLGDIAAHPTIPGLLFGARSFSTGAEEGIYRSDNGGTTWMQVSGIAGQRNILIDPLQQNLMYAFGGDYGGIWRSIDGGETWSIVSTQLPGIVAQPTILSAISDPTNPNTIWVGVKYAGIYVSNDNGETWYEANYGILFFGGSINGPQCSSIDIKQGNMAVACSGRIYIKEKFYLTFVPVTFK